MSRYDRGGLTEEEMAEVIASRDWPAYRAPMKHCREGKASPNGKHSACPGFKQPTNHIDPHPSICTCKCHEWNEEEVVWEDDEVGDPEDIEWDDDVSNEEELDWDDV